MALGGSDGAALGKADVAALLVVFVFFPAFVILGVRASSCLTLFPPLKGTATVILKFLDRNGKKAIVFVDVLASGDGILFLVKIGVNDTAFTVLSLF